MSDVQVSLGGDLTPIQKSFAEVKAQAKEAGDAVGLEFGNRTAYMAEERVKLGMDGVLKSLSTAKDPIDAIAGAIEGIGSSFRIAGAGMLAFGIGTFVKDQLEKAAGSATAFFDKIDQGFAVGKNSTKEFAEGGLKALQDAEKQYENRGWLERMIYGKSEDQALPGVKSKIDEITKQLRDAREAEYKTSAEELAPDLDTQRQGAIDAANQEYDEKIKKAQEFGDDTSDIEKARQEKLHQIMLDFNKKDEEAEEPARKAAEEDLKKRQKYAQDIAAEKEKQAKLADEAGATTDSKKIEALQKELAANKAAQNEWMEGLDREKLITREMEIQNELTREQAALAQKKADIQKEISDKLKEQTEARDTISALGAEAMGYHGQVSSLRREGFGGRVGPNQNGEQLKALGEANKHLEKIREGIDALVKKEDQSI